TTCSCQSTGSEAQSDDAEIFAASWPGLSPTYPSPAKRGRVAERSEAGWGPPPDPPRYAWRVTLPLRGRDNKPIRLQTGVLKHRAAMTRWRTTLDRLIVLIAILAAWQLASFLVGPYWVSSPGAVAARFAAQLWSGELIRHGGYTIEESLIGTL